MRFLVFNILKDRWWMLSGFLIIDRVVKITVNLDKKSNVLLIKVGLEDLGYSYTLSTLYNP